MKQLVSLICLFTIFWPSRAISQGGESLSTIFYNKAKDTGLNKEQRLYYAHKCLDLLDIKNEDTLYYKINSSLSTLKRDVQQFDSAAYYAKNIIAYGETHKDNYVTAFGFHKLGYLNENFQKPIEALKNYDEGLAIALAGNEGLKAAQLYRAKCDVLNFLGDFSLAEEEATRGLRILKAETKGHPKETYKLYLSLSNAFQNNKKFRESIIYLNKAYAIAQTNFQRKKVLNNKGNALRKENKYDEAIGTYLEALKMNNNAASKSEQKTNARLKDNLGITYFEKGLLSKGYEYMLQAFEERKRLKDASGLHASYIHLLDYYSTTQSTNAPQFAKEAYEYSKQIKSPGAEVEVLYYLIQLVPDRDLITRHLVLTDSLNTVQQKRQNSYVSSKFLLEEKEKDLLISKNIRVEQELTIARKDRNTILLLAALGITTIGLGLYFYYYRRNKIQASLIESLHKELHHRVLNNFAIIDTFIGVTQDKTTDLEVQKKLSELQNRIQSICEVHEQLYNSDDITLVDFQAYARRIVQKVQASFGNTSVKINLDTSERIKLPSKQTFPLGIIINEFVTNSYKYAFDESESGEIWLRFRESANTYSLTLKDNGPGLPEKINMNNVNSFGIRVIQLLSKQLKSDYFWSYDSGLKFTITFNK